MSLVGEKGKATLDGVREALVQKLDEMVSLSLNGQIDNEVVLGAIDSAIAKMGKEELAFDDFYGSEMGKMFINGLTQRLKLQTKNPIPRQSLRGDISDDDLEQSFRTILTQFKTDLGEKNPAIDCHRYIFAKVNENLERDGRPPIETRDQAVAYMMDQYKNPQKVPTSKIPARAIQNYVAQSRFATVSTLDSSNYDISKGFASNDLIDRANSMADTIRLEFYTPAVPDEVVALDGIIKAAAAVRLHASQISDKETKAKAIDLTKKTPTDSAAPDADGDVAFTQIFSTNTMAQVVETLTFYADNYLTELKVAGDSDSSVLRSEGNAFVFRIVTNNVRQAIKYMQYKLDKLADDKTFQSTDDDTNTFEGLQRLDEKLEETASKNVELLESIDGKMPNVFSDDQRTEYKGGPLNRRLQRPTLTRKTDNLPSGGQVSIFQTRGVKSGSGQFFNRPGGARQTAIKFYTKK
ncbi:hypothetical protein BC829DRAFT_394651 [Chytridium lagenaria]|nr:hypothetical protein BC829DRAFT_394651 [Chytridium lagenaria]